MKLVAYLAVITLAAISLNAQTKPTTAADYNGTFTNAVSETNSAFPFVFTVVTEKFKGGNLMSIETEVNERQAAGVEREMKTLKRDGMIFRSYSVMVRFGKGTYCSTDGVTWTGPQEFVCDTPDGSGVVISRPSRPEQVDYSVTEDSIDGRPVKIYRKYAVFKSTDPSGRKDFEEETAIIDSRGFFISVSTEEGTLDPTVVDVKRKQTWDFKTKFKPVVAPK